jgi:hypothetical protein
MGLTEGKGGRVPRVQEVKTAVGERDRGAGGPAADQLGEQWVHKADLAEASAVFEENLAENFSPGDGHATELLDLQPAGHICLL